MIVTMDNMYKLQQGKIITDPIYLEQLLDEYKGNPFIEALPNIFTDKEVARSINLYPSFKEEERLYDANIRFHMIRRLRNFIQTLGIHIDIQREISGLIRSGYVARNPVSPEYLERLNFLYSSNNKLIGAEETLRSTAQSYSIIGMSGVGKTTAIERTLCMYPQIIVHKEYNNKPLTRTQVVWLKVDCPHDGSIKTLCKTFFKSIDNVLGTNYLEKFGYNRYSTASMMIEMNALAARHGLGLLVIDEIQHLINKRVSSDEMLNFLVTLVNTTGVPIVLVGTSKALEVFEKNFRQARRAEGITWYRMNNDETWQFFLETMWRYQWLRNYTQLNKELSQTMYDESQGITAIAVNLYMFSQIRAIANGNEKITSSLIKDVSKNELSRTYDMITALKNNDLSKLSMYDDISPNVSDEVFDNYDKKTQQISKVERLVLEQEKIRENDKEQFIDEIINTLVLTGLFKETNYNKFVNIIKEIVNKSKDLSEEELKLAIFNQCLEEKKNTASKKKDIGARKFKICKESELVKLYKIAKTKNKRVYNVLKDNGFIKDCCEFEDL